MNSEELGYVKDNLMNILQTEDIHNIVVGVETKNDTSFLHFGTGAAPLIGLAEMLKSSIVQTALYNIPVNESFH